ncbi:MAG: hypothetical protein AAGC97_11640 [Planctomycetota bacterium]
MSVIRAATWVLLFNLLISEYLGAGTAEESEPVSHPHLIVVMGAGGTPEYQSRFEQWSARIQTSALGGGMTVNLIGGDMTQADSDVETPINDKHSLQLAIERAETPSDEALWIVLIGHGTFYANEAKFNLVGSDVSAKELRGWLDALERPVVVVNTASASAPFVNELSGDGRIVVSATKSGTEDNATVFGDYFTQSLESAAADLDHDDEVSVLEAFRYAVDGVGQYYELADRIATEHAIIDDNGDGQGTRSKAIETQQRDGSTIDKPASKDTDAIDGSFARRVTWPNPDASARLTPDQRQRRDALESKLDELRMRRSTMDEDAYFGELESILLPLARIYAEVSSE